MLTTSLAPGAAWETACIGTCFDLHDHTLHLPAPPGLPAAPAHAPWHAGLGRGLGTATPGQRPARPQRSASEWGACTCAAATLGWPHRTLGRPLRLVMRLKCRHAAMRVSGSAQCAAAAPCYSSLPDLPTTRLPRFAARLASTLCVGIPGWALGRTGVWVRQRPALG